MAWDVFGNGKTSVRRGVGLHHSLLDALDYRLDQAAPYNTVLQLLEHDGGEPGERHGG